MINVYLDNCCYDRPFDDLRQKKIRQEGLKVLKEKLGPVGIIKFIQMYSDGEGYYKEERKEKLASLKEEDLQKYLMEELN